MKRLLVLTLLAVSAYGQAPDEELVTVPKKYVSSQGLEHQSAVDTTSKWVGIGREIGIATREGLNSVVDVSEKFGHTNVGMFVMVMVAWKIIGHDLLMLIFGLPIWIAAACIWIWSLRRFFFGYRMISRKEGRVKEYVQVPPYKFTANEAKVTCGVVHVAIAIGLFIVLLAVIL